MSVSAGRTFTLGGDGIASFGMSRPPDPHAGRNILSYAAPSAARHRAGTGGASTAVRWAAAGLVSGLACEFLGLLLLVGGAGHGWASLATYSWPVLFAAPAAGAVWAYRRRPVVLPVATALILVGLFLDSQLWTATQAEGARRLSDFWATLPWWFLALWALLWLAWQFAAVAAFAVAAVASFRE